MTVQSIQTQQKLPVIGMALIAPGSVDLNTFWRNIVTTKRLFSKTEPDQGDLRYVRGTVSLPDTKALRSLGVSKAEERLVSPHYMLTLKAVSDALSDALGPKPTGARIGIYTTSGVRLPVSSDQNSSVTEQFSRECLTSSDCLATFVSYKLDLRGISTSIQSACSSSLVAIHEARKSLLMGECDLVVAAGVNYRVFSPYRYQKGMIFSNGGECFPFSRFADGTVESDAVGAVVLATPKFVAEHDSSAYCTVITSAVNNDGASKNSFSAPSIEGQIDVYSMAIASCGIEPESLGMIEAHGTATLLGDATELESLHQFYGAGETGSISVGSVKAHVGHTYQAAGVVSFIKTALSIANAYIAPGYKGDIKDSIFPSHSGLCPATGVEWMSNTPRRAGVTSLGIGGTNAHVILEECTGLLHHTKLSMTASLPMTMEARDEEAFIYEKKLSTGNIHSSIGAPGTIILASKVFLENIVVGNFVKMISLEELTTDSGQASLAALLDEKEGSGLHVYKCVINAFLCDKYDDCVLAELLIDFQKTLMPIAEIERPLSLIVSTLNGDWAVDRDSKLNCSIHACGAFALCLELENRNIRTSFVDYTNPVDCSGIVRADTEALADNRHTMISDGITQKYSFNAVERMVETRFEGKTIVITGGGKIADRLVQLLRGENTVIVLSRSSSVMSGRWMKVDVTNIRELKAALQDVKVKFGSIDLVIHTAAYTESTEFPFVTEITKMKISEGISAKVKGLENLEVLSASLGIQDIVVLSSVSTVLGGSRFSIYAAANRYVDAMACGSEVLRSIALDTIYLERDRRDDHCLTPADVYEAISFAVTYERNNLLATRGGKERLSGRIRSGISPDEQPNVSIADCVLSVLGKLLDEDSIETEDILEKIGLDSMLTLDLVDSLEILIGVSVPISRISRCTTVGELIACCDSAVKM